MFILQKIQYAAKQTNLRSEHSLFVYSELVFMYNTAFKNTKKYKEMVNR